MHAARYAAFERDARTGTRFASTPRMATRRSGSLISDAVPTHCDEVTNVTRIELVRAFRSLVAPAEATWNDDVFAEDTVEVPAAAEPTLF